MGNFDIIIQNFRHMGLTGSNKSQSGNCKYNVFWQGAELGILKASSNFYDSLLVKLEILLLVQYPPSQENSRHPLFQQRTGKFNIFTEHPNQTPTASVCRIQTYQP